MDDYKTVAAAFRSTSTANYQKAKGRYRDIYQQFFFRARDDVDRSVEDFFLHFYVDNGKPAPKLKELGALSEQIEGMLKTKFYRHSSDPSCRAMMLKLNQLNAIRKLLDDNKARLVMEINASCPVPNVSYQSGKFIAYDGTGKAGDNSNPLFLYPNTTTLVDLVLNRAQTDKLINLKDYNLKNL
jgi:hypothetical protein